MGIVESAVTLIARPHRALAFLVMVTAVSGIGSAQDPAPDRQELFDGQDPQMRPSAPDPGPKPGDGARRLDDRLRFQRVALTPDGTLRGRLSVLNPEDGAAIPIQSVRVSVLRGGKVVATAQPQTTGEFAAPGLEPGAHAVVAAGEQGFMAFSVELVAAPAAGEARRRPAARLLEVRLQASGTGAAIDGAAVPPANFSVLRTLVRNYVPIRVGNSPSTPGPQDTAAEAGAAEPIEPAEAGDPSAGILRDHTVRLQPGGRLVGRVRRLHPQTGESMRLRRTNVFLLQDNEVVLQAPVDEDRGMFAFEGVDPGTYSVAAVGPGNLAAFSVYVLDEDDHVASRRPAGTRLASSLRRQAPSQLEFTVVGPENIDAALQIAARDLPGGGPGAPPPPGPNPPVALPPGVGPGGFGPGGFGGPGGGGGFGGGGGGGLGGGGGAGIGLLAAGGAAAAIVAIADDNQSASPFVP